MLGDLIVRLELLRSFKTSIPMQNILTVPILLIGLKKPDTFYVEQFQYAPQKKLVR